MFFSAAFIALRSIVICELLGVAKLSNALGLLLLFQGLASVVGTPLSGKLMSVFLMQHACPSRYFF